MPIIPIRAPRLDTGDAAAKRAEIRAYFHATWDTYDRLFEVMAADEAWHRRADPLRHPLIFYLGHTACFYVNKLLLAKAIDRRVNPRFESQFAIGVDEMSWDDLDGGNYDWPPVAEVRQYRREVRAVVDQVISDLPLELPIGWDSPFWVVMMGIEHERIHLETSSVLIRQLPLELLRPSPDWAPCDRTGAAPDNGMLDVPGGLVVQGKPRNDHLYGWDTEYGRLETRVASFRAARFLVSNAEFKLFVDAGGYGQQRWWTEEGWGWRTYQDASHPRFWVPAGEAWRLRCLGPAGRGSGVWPPNRPSGTRTSGPMPPGTVRAEIDGIGSCERSSSIGRRELPTSYLPRG